MRIWIDLANSPHPLLFAPVIRRLEELGHESILTARDNAQTVELTTKLGLQADTVGGPSPAGRLSKARVLGERVEELRRWTKRVRPDIALSHNSYAQIVAARSRGIRAVTAMDFEHQPANHVAFRLANLVLLPEALPAFAVRRQGAKSTKTRHYPGLKEQLYLGDFSPDDQVVHDLGISRRAGRVIVITRTPPTRALYHGRSHNFYLEVLRALSAQRGVQCVVLPRHPEQHAELVQAGVTQVVIPTKAIDARALMYEADLVVGAGGTMTREAALLGVPTFTVFAGRRPSVDKWLEDRGLLKRLSSIDDVSPVSPRAHDPVSVENLRLQSKAVVEAFVEATVSD